MTMDFTENPWLATAQQLLSQADVKINGTRPWDIRIKNPAVFERVVREGSLGLGESYMDGWWECEHLDQFFYQILKHKLKDRLSLSTREIIKILATRFLNFQTKQRAWTVGEVHYNLGNELFVRMLDPYMQYSCGYWLKATTLEAAQEDKLRLICQKLQLEPGMHVLDIGCGWGGLAEYMVRNYDVIVTGLTISSEQKKLAEERCKGLNVTILLQDYRDIQGAFDRIVSVGMLEHVGPKNYATYFNIVDTCLRSEGLFLLQTIGVNKSVGKCDDWIHKYIFPNGCMPSIKQISAASEPYFVMEDWHNLGTHYDKTLMAWYKRFITAWPDIAHSYDQRFKRMFEYYLLSCAGVFRARECQLWQVVFSRGREGGLHVPR